MFDALVNIGFPGQGGWSIVLDIGAKAAMLMLAALLLHALLGTRRTLARSAAWNACLVTLLLLPAVTLAFPRWQLAWLPAEADMDVPALDAPDGRSIEPAPVVGEDGGAAEFSEGPMAGPEVRGDADPGVGAPEVLQTEIAGQWPPQSPFLDSPPADHEPVRRPAGGAAVAAMIYLGVAALLLIRLIASIVAVHRLASCAQPCSDAMWIESLERWRSGLAVRRRVPLLVSGRIDVPIALGWLRPAIVLPSSMMSEASHRHRDAVVLHELAHIRRNDCLWLLLMRVLQVVYWPHPLIWLVGRMMASVREHACDDLCAHCLHGAAAYRAALLDVAAGLPGGPIGPHTAAPAGAAGYSHILKSVRMSSGPRRVSLGIAMARSSRLARRLRRIDRGSTASDCLSRRPLRFIVTVMALGLAMGLGSAQLARRQAQANDSPDEQPGRVPNAIRILVIERESGRPVPNAELRVQLGWDSAIHAADVSGGCTVDLPDALESLRISAYAPGFAPRGRTWSSHDRALDVPDECTLELERGTSIGGVVQDQAGAPIAGARVHALMFGEEYASADFDCRPATADAQGRWRINHMPSTIDRLAIHLSHSDFISNESGIPVPARDTPGPTLDELRNMTAKLVMMKGHEVTGRVLDEQGNPVADASMALGHRGALHVPTTTTDRDGVFKFPHAAAGRRTLSVIAPGLVQDFQYVGVHERTPPVEFRLKKSKGLRGRVVDAAGRPIRGAWVAVEECRGERGALQWRGETDAEGRFVWTEAPDDAVDLSLGRAGYMCVRRFFASTLDGDVEITMHRPIRVRGTAVDAETGHPIQNLATLRGGLSLGAVEMPFTHTRETWPAGAFDYVLTEPNAGHFMRVEAEGYEPAESRQFKPGDGDQTFEFKLERSEGISGIVMDATGAVLAGAEVILCPMESTGVFDGAMVENGKNVQRRDENTVTTKSDGRFWFAPRKHPFTLVVLHERGYGEMTSKALAESKQIRVRPWGRIEGMLRIGAKPAAGEKVSLSFQDTRRDLDADIEYRCFAMTDDGGCFVMDRVPAGEGRVYREIRFPDGRGFDMHMACEGEPFEITAGQVLHIDLGGTGLPIVGRVRTPPELVDKFEWANAIGYLGFEPPEPIPPDIKAGGPAAEQRWRQAWYTTPDYKAHWRKARWYKFRVEADGSFRIDDVPAGTYVLSIAAHEPPPRDQCGGDIKIVGHVHVNDVIVPEMPSGRSDEPLDIGMLELKAGAGQAAQAERRLGMARELRAGDAAPHFEVPTLGGKRLKLSDYRGKFVLLDFWATWCGPCRRETPHLKELFEAFGKDDHFVMIGLSLDKDAEAPKKYVKENDLAWTQGFLGDWALTTLPSEYGVSGIPAIMLIDPDGKVVAKNLGGGSIKSAVAAALGQSAPAGKGQTRAAVKGTAEQQVVLASAPGERVAAQAVDSRPPAAPAASTNKTSDPPSTAPAEAAGGKTVHGVVRGPDGAPVAGADVWLFRQRPAWEQRSEVFRHTTSDAVGRFRFDGVAFDEQVGVDFNGQKRKQPYAFYLAARDGRKRLGWRSRVAAGEVHVDLCEVADLRLPVVDEHEQPIPGVKLTLKGFFTPDPRDGTRALDMPEAFAAEYLSPAGDGGGFVLHNAPRDRRAWLVLAGGGYDDLQVWIDLKEGQSIRLPSPGKVRGELKLPEGAGTVRGVKLTCATDIMADRRDSGCQFRSVVSECQTDAAGKFSLDGLLPGTYQMRALLASNAPVCIDKQQFDVMAGETTVVSVPASRAVAVNGRVVDGATGAGIEGAAVAIQWLDERDSISDRRTAVTGPDGRFSGYTRPGQIIVSIPLPPEGYLPPPEARQHERRRVEADTEWPEFALDRATVVNGVVVDESGRPLEAEIQVCIPNRELPLSREPLFSDAEGRFSVSGLDPDDTVPFRARTATGTTEGAIIIRPGELHEPLRLVVSDKYACRLRGRVADAGGRPVSDSGVSIWWHVQWSSEKRRGGGFARPLVHLKTGADGSFESPPVWPGDEYEAHIEAKDFLRTESEKVAGAAGRTIDLGTIQLRSLGRYVEGRVLDSAGQPLGGVAVFNLGDAEKRVENISSADGRFRVGPLIEGPAYVFATKDGYRFSGRRTAASESDVEMRLLRRDEERPVFPVPYPSPRSFDQEKQVARRLIEQLWEAPGVRNDSAGSLIQYMARIDQAKAREWATVAGGQKDGWVKVETAVLAAEQDAGEAIGILAGLSDRWAVRYLLPLGQRYLTTDPQKAMRFAEEAAVRVRGLEPAERARYESQLGTLLVDLGRVDAGRALIEQAVAEVAKLADGNDENWAQRAAAAALAPFDLDRALALIGAAERSPPEVQEHTLGQIVVAAARTDEAKASKLLERITTNFRRDDLKHQIAYFVARRDPESAVRIAETIQKPAYRAMAFGWIAVAAASKDRQLAHGLIDRGLDVLAENPAEMRTWSSYGQAGSFAARLAYQAKLIGYPDMESIVWRVLAMRTPRGDAISDQIWIDEHVATAMVLALTDPGAARMMLQDLEPLRVRGPGRPQFTREGWWYMAWALTKPEHAVELANRDLEQWAGNDGGDGGVPIHLIASLLTTPPDQRHRRDCPVFMNMPFWFPDEP